MSNQVGSCKCLVKGDLWISNTLPVFIIKGVLQSFMEVWGIMYNRADRKTNDRDGPYFKCVLIILVLSKPTKPGVCLSADASIKSWKQTATLADYKIFLSCEYFLILWNNKLENWNDLKFKEYRWNVIRKYICLWKRLHFVLISQSIHKWHFSQHIFETSHWEFKLLVMAATSINTYEINCYLETQDKIKQEEIHNVWMSSSNYVKSKPPCSLKGSFCFPASTVQYLPATVFVLLFM